MEKQDLVYHYTSAESFLGMLQGISKDRPFPKCLTFWATNLAYMNDPQEIKYGEALAKKYIQKRESESNCRIELKDKPNPFSLLLEKIFSISFSEERDLLPMWSMYGNFDGICLGFNLKKNDNFSGCANENEVTRILYGKDSNIETLYNSIISLCIPKNIYSNIKDIASTILYKVLSCFIKHPSYSYEKEYRMIIPECKNEKIKFRCKNGTIIPYIEHEIPICKLKSITFGPSSRIELIENSMKMLLDSKGINIDNIAFVKSNIPFRVI